MTSRSCPARLCPGRCTLPASERSVGLGFLDVSHPAVRQFGMTRAVEQDLVVVLSPPPPADVLQRVAQGLDRRFEGRLDVPSLELQTVDLPLHVFEPGLRLLEQHLGSTLRLADDALRFL